MSAAAPGVQPPASPWSRSGHRNRAAAELTADPARSDISVAVAAGCSRPVVYRVRAELEARGVIPVIPVADRVRISEEGQAAEAARDAALLQLRSPAPGQAAYLSNQVINALAAPAEDACREPGEAGQAAAAIPARSRSAPSPRTWPAWTPGPTRSPTPSGWPRTTPRPPWPAPGRPLRRAGDEAYALIREALTASGDIQPSNGELLIRLDPLIAPRRAQALAALCDQLTAARACYPGTDLILRYEVKSRPSPA